MDELDDLVKGLELEKDLWKRQDVRIESYKKRMAELNLSQSDLISIGYGAESIELRIAAQTLYEKRRSNYEIK